MQVIKAPSAYKLQGKVGLFLAGSIAGDKAEPWQQKLTEELQRHGNWSNLVVLNPRRDAWDSSWLQSKYNVQFHEQVSWELDGMEQSDVIAVYFDPKTESPVTLMEIGLFANRNMIVFCPEGYWRKGNVDIVCERYHIKQANNWEEFVAGICFAVKACEVNKLQGVW